jgi:glutamyl-tRNA reductase
MKELALYRGDLTSGPDGIQPSLVTLAEAVRRGELRDDTPGDTEVVALATCERVECYLSRDDEHLVRRLRAAGAMASMHRLVGEDAVRHLFRVAAGLESRIPGEPHILGQVRSALAHSTQEASVGPTLTALFRAAIDCGRRVRRACHFGAHGDSYVARAIDVLRAELFPLARQHAVIVGASTLGREVAHALRAAGVERLTIVGRHPPRIETLAREVGGEWVTLDRFSRGLACDAIVTAVACAVPILRTETVAACRARLVMDLGGTPNVSRDGPLGEVRLVRLADLAGHPAACAPVEQAAQLVDREVQRFAAAQRGTWRTRLSRLAS